MTDRSEITGLTFEEIKEIHKDTTSLQALDYLHRFALDNDNCKPRSVEEKFRRFLRDKVEQDLEVLKILKKVFPKEVLEHELNDAYECNKISEEEYKFLKDWLERSDK